MWYRDLLTDAEPVREPKDMNILPPKKCGREQGTTREITEISQSSKKQCLTTVLIDDRCILFEEQNAFFEINSSLQKRTGHGNGVCLLMRESISIVGSIMFIGKGISGKIEDPIEDILEEHLVYVRKLDDLYKVVCYDHSIPETPIRWTITLGDASRTERLAALLESEKVRAPSMASQITNDPQPSLLGINATPNWNNSAKKPEDNHVLAESAVDGRLIIEKPTITPAISFVCRKCNKSFPSNNQLHNHIRNSHTSTRRKSSRKPYYYRKPHVVKQPNIAPKPTETRRACRPITRRLSATQTSPLPATKMKDQHCTIIHNLENEAQVRAIFPAQDRAKILRIDRILKTEYVAHFASHELAKAAFDRQPLRA